MPLSNNQLQQRTVTGGPMTTPLKDCGAVQRSLQMVLTWSEYRSR